VRKASDGADQILPDEGLISVPQTDGCKIRKYQTNTGGKSGLHREILPVL
jgi:hypothetical protein